MQHQNHLLPNTSLNFLPDSQYLSQPQDFYTTKQTHSQIGNHQPSNINQTANRTAKQTNHQSKLEALGNRLFFNEDRSIPGVGAMGSPRPLSDAGKRMRGQISFKQSLCDAVVQLIIQRVRAAGHGNHICEDLQKHFATLPARYALNVDPMRHEDVFLHMRLLQEARDLEAYVRDNPSEPFPMPVMHVRKVLLQGSGPLQDGDEEMDDGQSRRGMTIPCVPKPAFGSNLNLAGLASSSPSSFPRNHSRIGSSPSVSTPPGKSPSPGQSRGLAFRNTPPGRQPPLRLKSSSSCKSLADMDEDSSESSGQENKAGTSYGWEITVATADRHGLLKCLTSSLCSISHLLNIKEAHAFSSTDGMALEVFVIDGWKGGNAEELWQAVLRALKSKLSEITASPPMSEMAQLAELKKAVEAIAYEDWAVDFHDLELGESLGGGSSGRLYRGVYRGQEVAVKVMVLNRPIGSQMSGSLRAAPAAELLQMFKQEVAIMRIVRHKNLVQFIGACSCWPRLFIVTELMAGGSVRDVLQCRGSGVEATSAVKILRDTARGLDFLHRRGVVHRDVKAANLLIDEHDVVKVCDFGVARMVPGRLAATAVSGDWRQCQAEEMTAETGTYRWMAPEVLEHRPYNHKADVYSFGILIWEIITGGVPHSALTPLQAAIGVVQRGLRPTMPESCPSKLTALAEVCWRANPDERPEFSEVLTALDECLKPTLMWKRAIFGQKKK